MDVFVQEATTDIYDYYVQYWQEKTFSLATIPKVQQSMINSNSNLKAHVRVRLDHKYATFGRVADTVFSALESIGGFMESLMHIGFLLVFFFQERLFKGAFIR